MPVLDACAMIAYFRDEPGAEKVESIWLDNRGNCHAHALNLCEVYYHFLRERNKSEAEQIISDLSRGKVIVHSELDEALWKHAAQIKSVNKISLADSVAIALALRLNDELVTSDHHEMDAIQVSGVCKINFIR